MIVAPNVPHVWMDFIEQDILVIAKMDIMKFLAKLLANNVK